MNATTIIMWVVFGLIVGAVANLVDPHPNRMGILGSIVLGMLGAVLGGLLSSLLGFTGFTGFNVYSFIIALIGSLIVLALGRSLYPGGGTYGPEYYDEDYDDTVAPSEKTVVETRTRKVRRNDQNDL